jgi:hypothetical protein
VAAAGLRATGYGLTGAPWVVQTDSNGFKRIQNSKFKMRPPQVLSHPFFWSVGTKIRHCMGTLDGCGADPATAERVGAIGESHGRPIEAPCAPLPSDRERCWCPRRLNKAVVSTAPRGRGGQTAPCR